MSVFSIGNFTQSLSSFFDHATELLGSHEHHSSVRQAANQPHPRQEAPADATDAASQAQQSAAYTAQYGVRG